MKLWVGYLQQYNQENLFGYLTVKISVRKDLHVYSVLVAWIIWPWCILILWIIMGKAPRNSQKTWTPCKLMLVCWVSVHVTLIIYLINQTTKVSINEFHWSMSLNYYCTSCSVSASHNIVYFHNFALHHNFILTQPWSVYCYHALFL